MFGEIFGIELESAKPIFENQELVTNYIDGIGKEVLREFYAITGTEGSELDDDLKSSVDCINILTEERRTFDKFETEEALIRYIVTFIEEVMYEVTRLGLQPYGFDQSKDKIFFFITTAEFDNTQRMHVYKQEVTNDPAYTEFNSALNSVDYQDTSYNPNGNLIGELDMTDPLVKAEVVGKWLSYREECDLDTVGENEYKLEDYLLDFYQDYCVGVVLAEDEGVCIGVETELNEDATDSIVVRYRFEKYKLPEEEEEEEVEQLTLPIF